MSNPPSRPAEPQPDRQAGWATQFKFFELSRIKSEEDKDSVLYEAEGKLNSLKKEVWRYLAIELRGEVTLLFLNKICDKNVLDFI